MFKHLLYATLAICLLAIPLKASSTFTLGTGYGYASNGWVVGPITGSQLNGAAIGPVLCMDDQDRSYLGTSWQVEVNTLPTLQYIHPNGPAVVQQYEEAAVLVFQAELPAQQNTLAQAEIQAALDDIFHPGTADAFLGLPAGTDDAWLSYAMAHTGDYTYNFVEVFTPVGAGNDNQTFLTGASLPSVPEPSAGSLFILGGAMVVAGIALRYRIHISRIKKQDAEELSRHCATKQLKQ